MDTHIIRKICEWQTCTMHNAHKYIIMRVSGAPFGRMREKLIKNLLRRVWAK